MRGTKLKKYVYVDYENMNNLKSFPKIDGKYFFFIGAKQANIPKSLVFASNNSNVEWIEIDGSGKNALDFHIAYYLSKNDSLPDVSHYILSKDQGFDPLISSINKKYNNQKKVRRIINLNDLSSSSQTNSESSQKTKDVVSEKYEKTVKDITSVKNKTRPTTEKKLKSFIQAHANCTETEAQDILEELYRKRMISKGGNNRLSYSKSLNSVKK